MQIISAQQYSDTLLIAINQLLAQLSDNARVLTADHLNDILDTENSRLFLVQEAQEICGMCMLNFYRIPSGLMAHIDDMVIGEKHRGKGWGEKLIRFVMQAAAARSADAILLSSHPSRISANALYKKVGFKQYDTNMYLYTF